LRREKSSAPAGVSLDLIAAVNPGESLLGLPAEGMELNCSGSEVRVRKIGKLPFGTLPFREAAKRPIADLVTRQVECRQWPRCRLLHLAWGRMSAITAVGLMRWIGQQSVTYPSFSLERPRTAASLFSERVLRAQGCRWRVLRRMADSFLLADVEVK